MIVIAKLFKNKELEEIGFVKFSIFQIPDVSGMTVSKTSQKLYF